MKIAVCVKHVPDATVHKRIDPTTKRLDRSGESALNPTDLNAVEEALRVKEAQGGEVVLVSLGPAKAADSLRKALAMGADRAVLVSDDGAAGSDLLGTSRVLAAVLERAGRIDEAREALERAVSIWERKGCLPCAERIRAQIASLGERNDATLNQANALP